jgi:hypothetical protein
MSTDPSQLTQKHALLSQYKQGMMQKLFSSRFDLKRMMVVSLGSGKL